MESELNEARAQNSKWQNKFLNESPQHLESEVIQLSEPKPNNMVNYENKLSLTAQQDGYLKNLDQGVSSDKEYLNRFFGIVFNETYLNGLIKQGYGYEKVLKIIRQSNQYEIIEKLFHRRILDSKKGDFKTRAGIYTLQMRQKLVNWWRYNATKHQNNASDNEDVDD